MYLLHFGDLRAAPVVQILALYFFNSAMLVLSQADCLRFNIEHYNNELAELHERMDILMHLISAAEAQLQGAAASETPLPARHA